MHQYPSNVTVYHPLWCICQDLSDARRTTCRLWKQQNPAKRGTIGNPRMADPMTDFVGLDVFTSVALAFLLEALPAKVKFVVEFWSTLLIQIEGTINRPSLPGPVTGRVALYFYEASKYFLLYTSILFANPVFRIVPPTTQCIRALGLHALIKHSVPPWVRLSGTRTSAVGLWLPFMGSRTGGTIFNPFDERAIGAIKEVFRAADIALAEVAGGVAADHRDYFSITPPQRIARMAECQDGNYMSADSC